MFLAGIYNCAKKSSTRCAKLNYANVTPSENEYHANFNTGKVNQKAFKSSISVTMYTPKMFDTTNISVISYIVLLGILLIRV